MRVGRDLKFEVRGSKFRNPQTSDLASSAGRHIAPFSPVSLVFFRQNREPYRAHQTHLVNLFSHVNFHFVSAGFPCAL